MSENVPEIILRRLGGVPQPPEIDYYDPTNEDRLDRIQHEQEAQTAEDDLFDRRRDDEAEEEIMHKANER